MQNSAPLVSWRGEHARIPLPLRVLGRYFVTGQSLRGPGDNATFLHRATVDYRARPYMTLSGPVWHRLARRHAAATIPLALACANWRVALLWWAACLVAALVWAVRRVGQAVHFRSRNRRWVDPAAKALCAAVSAPYVKRKARAYIDLPRVWEPDGGAVLVTVPTVRALTATQEKALVRGVGGRLGIVDAKGSWDRSGAQLTVTITGTPLPPAKVTIEDLQRAIALAPVSQPIAGMSATGAEHADLENDSPHVAVSGPAGTGKTTMLRLLLSQRMAHGAGLIMLDAKRWSHRWLHKLPEDRCRYAWRVADIHNTLVAVGEELERRIGCDEDELGTFREVDVVVEEINSLTKMLAAYWRGERKRIIAEAKGLKEMEADYDEADLDPPALSPAIAAMAYGVNMGRELQMHFWVAAQRLDANVFGSNSGGAVRNSFQLRFIAQWDRKLWAMLMNGLDYVAWPAGPRGLWGFGQGAEFKIIRVPEMSNVQAVDLAMSGPVHGPVLGPQVWPFGQIEGEVTEDTQAVVQAVRLSAAVDKLPGQPSLASVQRASTRPGFPESIGRDGTAKLYDLSSLIYWAESRIGQLDR